MRYQFLYLGHGYSESFEDKYEELILQNLELEDETALKQAKIFEQISEFL